MSSKSKRRMAVWLYPSTFEKIELQYEKDNCSSKSEFIEKAINFYIGFKNSKNDQDYWCGAFSDIVGGVVGNAERRIARLQFKQAVELAKLSKLMSLVCEIDDADLEKIHKSCIDEVKKIN